MATYHLYYLRDTLLIGSDDIEATDDAEAFRMARDMGNGHRVEVWNAHSVLMVVDSIPAKSEQPSRQAPVEYLADA